MCPKFSIDKLALVLALVVISANSQATVRYDFLGPSYQLIAGTIYDSSMFVQGYFETAVPILSDQSDLDISGLVLNYWFNDGVFSYNPANTGINDFIISTNPSGHIDPDFGNVEIRIDEFWPTPVSVGSTRHVLKIFLWHSEGALFECLTVGSIPSVECQTSGSSEFGISNEDGLWSGPTLVNGVPESTTLALMGLGLAGIGYKRCRSKKAA